MKLAKRFIIWAALMLAMVFVVNTAGTLVVKFVLADSIYAPALIGYSKKADTMIHPTLKEPDENNRTNGLSGLVMRSLLDDERFSNRVNFFYNFLFLCIDIDQSIIFFEEDGLSELSEGIYALAYGEKEDESLSHMRNATGVIDIRAFCELPNAKEFYDTLEQYPDAKLKLDSYSIDENFIIQPAEITVLNGGDSTIKVFDFQCDGKKISAENVYVYNSNDSGIDNEYHCFRNKMRDAYLGERKVEKVAKSLVDKVAFDGGDMYTMESSYGLGHYMTKYYEVKGDYSMICVLDFNFVSDVLVYIVVLGIIITLLTFLLGRKKKNEYY